MEKGVLKDGQRFQLEKGGWIGQLPFGYKAEKRIRRKNAPPKRVYIVEEEAAIIREMFELYATGLWTTRKMAPHLSAKYNRNFHRNTAVRALKNKFYKGVMTFKGHEFKHNHPRIISDELFDAARFPRLINKTMLSKGNYQGKPAKPLSDWQRFKLEKGEWTGIFPLGYKVERARKNTRYSIPGDVYVVEEEVVIVRELFGLYATGLYSVIKLAAHLSAKYNRTFHRSTTARMLQNKFYKGIMVVSGNQFKHDYPRIISDELFDAAQLPRLFNKKYALYGNIHSEARSAPNVKVKTPEPAKFVDKITFTIDDLINKQGMTLVEAQNHVLQRELDGEIEESGAGIWRTITRGSNV